MILAKPLNVNKPVLGRAWWGRAVHMPDSQACLVTSPPCCGVQSRITQRVIVACPGVRGQVLVITSATQTREKADKHVRSFFLSNQIASAPAASEMWKIPEHLRPSPGKQSHRPCSHLSQCPGHLEDGLCGPGMSGQCVTGCSCGLLGWALGHSEKERGVRSGWKEPHPVEVLPVCTGP